MPDITPTYLRSNAAGEVRAIFPGGVEILAATNYPTATPPTERRIRWVTEGNGALVADIVGAGDDSLFERYLTLTSYHDTGARAIASLFAAAGPHTPGGDRQAGITANAYGDPLDVAAAHVAVSGGSGQKLLLRGDGVSGFHHWGKYFLGPLATTAPPNATSGQPFVMPAEEIAGSDWWIEVTGAGWRGALGSGFIEVFVDGVNVSASPRLRFDVINSHAALPSGAARLFGFPNLLAGTHYVWLQSNGLNTSFEDGFMWRIYPGNFT